MIRLIVMILALIAVGMSQQVPNACANPLPMENFNASKFSGVWFTQLRTMRGLNTECEQIKFVLKSPTKLRFSGFSILRSSDVVTPILGCAKVQNNTGKLQVKVKQDHHNNSIHYEMRVVATDYDKYAVLWTCRDASSQLVVYTRELEPTTDVTSLSKKILREHNLSDLILTPVSQKNCPEYKFFIADDRDSSGTATRMGPMFIFRNRFTTPPHRSDE